MALTPISKKMSDCSDLTSLSNYYTNLNGENDDVKQYENAFQESLGIITVYKNFDFTKPYEMEISEGTYQTSEYPYKKFWANPTYTEFLFHRGDYISFVYDDRMCTFLILSVDNQYKYNVKGKLYECNNILNFIDDYGYIRKFPIVFNDRAQRTDFYFGVDVNTAAGRLECDLPMNEYTEQISINDRYIFNGIAYKVSYISKQNNIHFDTTDGIITLYLVLNEIFDGIDDVDNNLTNIDKLSVYDISTKQSLIEGNIGDTGQLEITVTKNGEIVNEPLGYEIIQEKQTTVVDSCDIKCHYPYAECPKDIIEEKYKIQLDDNLNYKLLEKGDCKVKVYMKNNIDKYVIIDVAISDNQTILQDEIKFKILPNTFTIRKTQSITYDCTKVVNGVDTTDILNITDKSTIAKGYYTIEFMNNSFTITNLKEHKSKKVEIEISDNNGNSTIISISLAGMW